MREISKVAQRIVEEGRGKRNGEEREREKQMAKAEEEGEGRTDIFTFLILY